jgi:hypothetical protein
MTIRVASTAAESSAAKNIATSPCSPLATERW